MSIPGILFGRSVVVTPRSTIEKVQRIENEVWRYLLGIVGYSTVESLRGEIGSSLMESRQMEASILFVKDGLECKFENVRIALENNINDNKGDWMHIINKFLKTIWITWEDIRCKNRQDIKEIIRNSIFY